MRGNQRVWPLRAKTDSNNINGVLSQLTKNPISHCKHAHTMQPDHTKIFPDSRSAQYCFKNPDGRVVASQPHQPPLHSKDKNRVFDPAESNCCCNTSLFKSKATVLLTTRRLLFACLSISVFRFYDFDIRLIHHCTIITITHCIPTTKPPLFNPIHWKTLKPSKHSLKDLHLLARSTSSSPSLNTTNPSSTNQPHHTRLAQNATQHSNSSHNHRPLHPHNNDSLPTLVGAQRIPQARGKIRNLQ